MTYGSKPNTPRKILKSVPPLKLHHNTSMMHSFSHLYRRTAASPLAATAPIKVRKVCQSPLVRSTTANRPPHSTRAKKIATKVSIICRPHQLIQKWLTRAYSNQTNQISTCLVCVGGGGGVVKQTPVRPTQKRLSRNSSRKILAERNASVATDDSLISHTNESLASTCSSYTDFQVRKRERYIPTCTDWSLMSLRPTQRGLIQGFGSAKTARSSAIPRSSSMDNVIWCLPLCQWTTTIPQ